MSGDKRVILFSTETERSRSTIEVLRVAGFQIVPFSDPAVFMREVRNGRDRVVILDFQSRNVEGLDLLREIERLDASVQVVVINAEAKLFTGIQVFRAGGEACFFLPAPPPKELCEVLDHAFEKIERWWRTLQEVASRRNMDAPPAPAEVRGPSSRTDTQRQARAAGLNDELEVILRGSRLKAHVEASSPLGMDLVLPRTNPPTLFDTLVLLSQGIPDRGIVHRIASHPDGGWRVGIEWVAATESSGVSVGPRADQTLFITVDGHHVAARSLVAVNKDWVSARLATGRIHAVPTNAVCALTRAEREAELLATDDLSFFADFYSIGRDSTLAAVAQSVIAIEFAAESPIS
jgi:DNA-binding response OmpR family regulator